MPGRQVAVITGASAGVGRATVRAFAEHGFDVGLLARGEAGLQAAAKDVEAAGGRALVVPTDVSQFAQVDAAAERVENELGPIDVWVNDAMTTVFAPTWEVQPADFQRAVEVTFLGQVWGTMAALSRMRPRDRGNIVNVGSALGIIGIPLQAAYCSSKFACRGFFESTRAELLHEGSSVQMSMVYLPAVNTPQFDWCKTTLRRHPQPVPPIYQPELIAKFILEAALSGRREKVIGSWNKLLVLAGRLFPGLGNQYAAIGAWDTQLTSEPISPGPPGQPVRARRRGHRPRRSRQLRRQGRRVPRSELPQVAADYGSRRSPWPWPATSRRSGARSRCPRRPARRSRWPRSGDRPGTARGLRADQRLRGAGRRAHYRARRLRWPDRLVGDPGPGRAAGVRCHPGRRMTAVTLPWPRRIPPTSAAATCPAPTSWKRPTRPRPGPCG